MPGNNRNKGQWPLGVLAIGIGLFFVLGGRVNLGKGSTPKEAAFSSTCEGPIGKWVECNGKVMSAERKGNGFLVKIRTHSGEITTLELDAWNIGSFPMDSEVRYKVKMGPTRYFSEVADVRRDTLEKYCTGMQWTKSKEGSLELKGGTVPIDIQKFPDLNVDSYKYIYIRDGRIVGVELHDNGRGCSADRDLLAPDRTDGYRNS